MVSINRSTFEFDRHPSLSQRNGPGKIRRVELRHRELDNVRNGRTRAEFEFYEEDFPELCDKA
jgi:hypothetical protein